MTIGHVGRFNTEWVQSWLYRAPVPPAVHINGCSAGGYAAIGHAGKMLLRYRDHGTSFISMHGDSAAGVGSDEFSADLKRVWSAYESLPQFIPEIKRAIEAGENIAFEQLYEWTAGYFTGPRFRFSQFNTALDYIQYFFWQLMVNPREVTQEEWGVLMTESVRHLVSDVPTFQAFWAGGQAHCILTRDYMYTLRGVGPSEGVLYVDWLRQFLVPGGAAINHANATRMK